MVFAAQRSRDTKALPSKIKGVRQPSMTTVAKLVIPRSMAIVRVGGVVVVVRAQCCKLICPMMMPLIFPLIGNITPFTSRIHRIPSFLHLRSSIFHRHISLEEASPG